MAASATPYQGHAPAKAAARRPCTLNHWQPHPVGGGWSRIDSNTYQLRTATDAASPLAWVTMAMVNAKSIPDSHSWRRMMSGLMMRVHMGTSTMSWKQRLTMWQLASSPRIVMIRYKSKQKTNSVLSRAQRQRTMRCSCAGGQAVQPRITLGICNGSRSRSMLEKACGMVHGR